jgi:hypothetical protein
MVPTGSRNLETELGLILPPNLRQILCWRRVTAGRRRPMRSGQHQFSINLIRFLLTAQARN